MDARSPMEDRVYGLLVLTDRFLTSVSLLTNKYVID